MTQTINNPRVTISNIFGASQVTLTGILEQTIKQAAPIADINLFRHLPTDWVKDKVLQEQASLLIEALDTPHKLLLNAVLWDFERLKQFCTVPSSLCGHHYEINGTLRHTVEAAALMQQICVVNQNVNASLALLMVLLHDIGKAVEYERNTKGSWTMSQRGILIGHKSIAYEWVVQAVMKWSIELPKDHYDAVLHSLSAVANAPDWMGLRKPIMQECYLVSLVDRLSGQNDLMTQTISPSGGFGRHHMHLGYSPFSVRG